MSENVKSYFRDVFNSEIAQVTKTIVELEDNLEETTDTEEAKNIEQNIRELTEFITWCRLFKRLAVEA